MSVADQMSNDGRQLQISLDLAGDRALICLAGVLDIYVEQDFIDAVNAATSTPGLVRLTLDVSALTLFGSSGVRCLLLARESAIERGVQFNVASTSNKSVRRTLDICELTDAFLANSPG